MYQKSFAVTVAAGLLSALLAASALADESQSVSFSRPNTVSVELLGRAGAYSLQYDHMMGDSFALGAGFSTLSANSTSLLILPVYTNYYFSPSTSRGFLTGGLDFASISGPLSGLTTSTVSASGLGSVHLGGGYEYRGEGGFLFRGTGYLLISSTISPWIGLSFGAAF